MDVLFLYVVEVKISIDICWRRVSSHSIVDFISCCILIAVDQGWNLVKVGCPIRSVDEGTEEAFDILLGHPLLHHVILNVSQQPFLQLVYSQIAIAVCFASLSEGLGELSL